MQYKVSRQYLRDKAKTIAQFTGIEDARLFIESRLSEDARLKANIIYRIVDMHEECLEEYNQDKAKIDTVSTGGMNSSSASRPSPFSTSPQPRNTVPKWTSNDDDK